MMNPAFVCNTWSRFYVSKTISNDIVLALFFYFP